MEFGESSRRQIDEFNKFIYYFITQGKISAKLWQIKNY